MAAVDQPGKGKRSAEKLEYYLPLAERLINGAVRQWLDTYVGTAWAAASTEERREGVNWTRSYLAEHDITLTPKIVDELQRAGLLKRPNQPKE